MPPCRILSLDGGGILDEWEKVPQMTAFAETVDVRPAARFLRDVWLA